MLLSLPLMAAVAQCAICAICSEPVQVGSLEYIIKMEMFLKQIQYRERDQSIQMHPYSEKSSQNKIKYMTFAI